MWLKIIETIGSYRGCRFSLNTVSWGHNYVNDWLFTQIFSVVTWGKHGIFTIEVIRNAITICSWPNIWWSTWFGNRNCPFECLIFTPQSTWPSPSIYNSHFPRNPNPTKWPKSVLAGRTISVDTNTRFKALSKHDRTSSDLIGTLFSFAWWQFASSFGSILHYQHSSAVPISCHQQ